MHCLPKKVLLTGGTGLIGKEAIKPLLEKGYEVYALTSGQIPKHSDPHVHWLQCNIFDTAALKAIFTSVQASHLLHFAWCSTGDYLTSDINYTFKAASLDMLRFFAENGGQKAVFAGTCFEYQFQEKPLHENDALNPTYAYSQCKVALHEAASSYCNDMQIDFGWGRIFYVYGIYEQEKRLTAHIIRSLLANKEVTISHGNLVRDYMYSKDIATAFVQFLDSKVTGTVNICSGKGISLADYARTIAQLLCKKHLLILKNEVSNQAPYIVGNTELLLQEIGFMGQYDLAQGIEDLLQKEYALYTSF